jgi:hypothetical protein
MIKKTRLNRCNLFHKASYLLYKWRLCSHGIYIFMRLLICPSQCSCSAVTWVFMVSFFRNELKWFLRMSLVQGGFSSFFFSSLALISFVTFLSYVMSGEILTASKVFMCVSMFSAVRVVMALYFPIAITMLNECKVSLIRMEVCL